MPLYLDVHNKVEGATTDALAHAHRKDLEVQHKYGVNYLRYWFDEGTGKVFCLVEAPSKEAAGRRPSRSPRRHGRRHHRGEGRQLAAAAASGRIPRPSASASAAR